jgi:hypothetical protein
MRPDFCSWTVAGSVTQSAMPVLISFIIMIPFTHTQPMATRRIIVCGKEADGRGRYSSVRFALFVLTKVTRVAQTKKREDQEFELGRDHSQMAQLKRVYI